MMFNARMLNNHQYIVFHDLAGLASCDPELLPWHLSAAKLRQCSYRLLLLITCDCLALSRKYASFRIHLQQQLLQPHSDVWNSLDVWYNLESYQSPFNDCSWRCVVCWPLLIWFWAFQRRMNQSKQIFDETWGGNQQTRVSKRGSLQQSIHPVHQYILWMPLTWKAPNWGHCKPPGWSTGASRDPGHPAMICND